MPLHQEGVCLQDSGGEGGVYRRGRGRVLGGSMLVGVGGVAWRRGRGVVEVVMVVVGGRGRCVGVVSAIVDMMTSLLLLILLLVEGEVQSSILIPHFISYDGVHVTVRETWADQIHVNIVWYVPRAVHGRL